MLVLQPSPTNKAKAHMIGIYIITGGNTGLEISA